MPRGPAPKPPSDRRRTNKPVHDWKPAPSTGWVGDKPPCPSELSDAATEAWNVWFGSWWSAFWCAEDVPVLELVAELYDSVHERTLDPSKLLPLLDRYGITPKGRHDLRWLAPGPSC